MCPCSGSDPDTRVMVLEGTEGRDYIYQDFEPGTRRRRTGEHDLSTVGLGLAIGEEAWFFPFRELQEAATPLQLTIGNQPLSVHFDAQGLAAWAQDATGALMMGVIAYETGWRSFHPDTRVWEH